VRDEGPRARVTASGLGSPRNGMPERLYVYRGTGEDTITGPKRRQREALERQRKGGSSGIEVAVRRPGASRPVPPQSKPETPVTASSRCGQCGYLVTAIGHAVACGGEP
jgi:hypothetical protein